MHNESSFAKTPITGRSHWRNLLVLSSPFSPPIANDEIFVKRFFPITLNWINFGEYSMTLRRFDWRRCRPITIPGRQRIGRRESTRGIRRTIRVIRRKLLWKGLMMIMHQVTPDTAVGPTIILTSFATPQMVRPTLHSGTLAPSRPPSDQHYLQSYQHLRTLTWKHLETIHWKEI